MKTTKLFDKSGKQTGLMIGIAEFNQAKAGAYNLGRNDALKLLEENVNDLKDKHSGDRYDRYNNAILDVIFVINEMRGETLLSKQRMES